MSQTHIYKNTQIHKYTNTQINKYTNTAHHEVPERSNMCYIFEKRICQRYKKLLSHVSNTQIQKYTYKIHKYTITQIQHMTKCQKDPTCDIFLKRGLFKDIYWVSHSCTRSSFHHPPSLRDPDDGNSTRWRCAHFREWEGQLRSDHRKIAPMLPCFTKISSRSWEQDDWWLSWVLVCNQDLLLCSMDWFLKISIWYFPLAHGVGWPCHGHRTDITPHRNG